MPPYASFDETSPIEPWRNREFRHNVIAAAAALFVVSFALVSKFVSSIPLVPNGPLGSDVDRLLQVGQDVGSVDFESFRDPLYDGHVSQNSDGIMASLSGWRGTPQKDPSTVFRVDGQALRSADKYAWSGDESAGAWATASCNDIEDAAIGPSPVVEFVADIGGRKVAVGVGITNCPELGSADYFGR